MSAALIETRIHAVIEADNAKRKERGYHIVVGLLICLVGLVVLVTVQHNGAKYAGLCILLSGSYTSAPLIVAWLSGNTPGEQ